MDENTLKSIRAGHDRIADEYAMRFFNELTVKFVIWAVGQSTFSRYLHDLRARVFGVDLSPQTVKLARKLNPIYLFARARRTTVSRVPRGQ